jgi:preprotein translocase subunit YajC
MLIDHAAFLDIDGAFMHPAFQAFLADTAAPSGAGGDPMQLVIMIAVTVGVFYFVVFRPQQKQQKELKTLVSSLKRGDEIVTQSGIIGTITLVDDQVVTLDIGAGNKLRVLKTTVAGAWKPGAPAAAAAPKQEKK